MKRQLRPRTSQSEPEADSGSGKWNVVGKRGRRKADRTSLRTGPGEDRRGQGYAGDSGPKNNRNEGQLRQAGKRRLPSTAVALRTLEDGGMSYADILKQAKSDISLADLGISNPRIRKAVNGGIIIEVPGADGVEKADKLANRLREIVGKVAHVARPTARGELLLIGLDKLIAQGEVIAAVVKAGGCPEESVRAGPIRPMRNELGLVWVQCPLIAVNKLIEEGRLLIGWTSVRVAPLKSRPLQCFRCWRLGHARVACKSATDRAGKCFRCGNEGHQAKNCQEAFSCAVCAAEGKDSAHRIGTGGCINNVDPGRTIRAN